MALATMKTRREIIARARAKYGKATKKEKGLILDGICEGAGLSRSRAKRLLAANGSAESVKKTRKREPKYDEEVTAALEKVWAIMDFPCGKRLIAGISDTLDALIRNGEIDIGETVMGKLAVISASTADRLLARSRQGLNLKGKSATKPGTLLKKDIPIRLGTEWDDAVPGFVEIDLVAHCGDTAAGEYVNTLDVTDICTGWTETAAVMNKAQRHVFKALLSIGERLPFPFRGIDSDNGSEFINAHLFRYCKENGIVFTRSRPYRKNDNCHVEQKNWHVVRRNIGYGRYEGNEAVKLMNCYYSSLRQYTNFFQPQAKLIEKTRNGSHIVKRYDSPKTPYRRLLDSVHVSDADKTMLKDIFYSLNPAKLKRDMMLALRLLMKYQITGKTR